MTSRQFSAAPAVTGDAATASASSCTERFGRATISNTPKCCVSRPIAGIQIGHDSGLVAYVDGEPAGWCNVEPRTAYPYFRSVPWRNRNEDRTDASIWAVPCFITRAGFRRQGVSYALARAALVFALERGARALEGYPMIPERGKDVPWGELHVGHISIFTASGFTEVSRPTLRRAVMRVDF